MKKTGTISKFISSLLVLLLLAGAIVLAFRFTNGFTEDFKTFYFSYNDKDVYQLNSKMCLVRGEEHRFDVKYTFNFLEGDEAEAKGYNVKIVPNVDEKTDFDFTANGNTYSYSSVGELTSAFDIDKQEDYFTLTLPETLTVADILETVYGGSVEAPLDQECPDTYLYTLVISSYDESVTYNVDFCIVFNISLNETNIVF